MANLVLWRVNWAYRKAEGEAFFDILCRLIQRKGNLVVFKGGRPPTQREKNDMKQKRARVLFSKFLSARDRRVLKKADLRLVEVVELLQE